MRLSKQEVLALAVAAIKDEADGLYELARSVQPKLAVAHAHALNGALHALINLEFSDANGENRSHAGAVEGLGLLGERKGAWGGRC